MMFYPSFYRPQHLKELGVGMTKTYIQIKQTVLASYFPPDTSTTTGVPAIYPGSLKADYIFQSFFPPPLFLGFLAALCGCSKKNSSLVH